jgi:hypothetical protein
VVFRAVAMPSRHYQPEWRLGVGKSWLWVTEGSRSAGALATPRYAKDDNLS